MTEPVIRDVVRVVEMNGPRGAVHLVHVLSCGCWVIRGKKPRKRMTCISCSMRPTDVGAPRVEDIAWQAFQAGIASGIPMHKLHEISYGTPTTAQRAFRDWWAKR